MTPRRLPPVCRWLLRRLIRAGLAASDSPEQLTAELRSRLGPNFEFPDPEGPGKQRGETVVRHRPASDHNATDKEHRHG